MENQNQNLSDILINVKDNLFFKNDVYLSVTLSKEITQYNLELYCEENCFKSNGYISQNDENLEHLFLYKIDLGNNYFLKINYSTSENTQKHFHKFIYPNDYLEDNIKITIEKKNGEENGEENEEENINPLQRFFNMNDYNNFEGFDNFLEFYEEDDDDSDMQHYKMVDTEQEVEDVEDDTVFCEDVTEQEDSNVEDDTLFCEDVTDEVNNYNNIEKEELNSVDEFI